MPTGMFTLKCLFTNKLVLVNFILRYTSHVTTEFIINKHENTEMINSILHVPNKSALTSLARNTIGI